MPERILPAISFHLCKQQHFCQYSAHAVLVTQEWIHGYTRGILWKKQ